MYVYDKLSCTYTIRKNKNIIMWRQYASIISCYFSVNLLAMVSGHDCGDDYTDESSLKG